MSKALYEYLDNEFGNEKYVELVFFDKEGNRFVKKYDVVGKYEKENSDYMDPDNDSEGDRIYLADKEILDKCDITNISMVIKTDSPQKVTQILNELRLPRISNYELKKNAMIEKQIVVKNKYVIAIVLFVLLGINLYSSFMNALSDRKFEIGVKRALGASKLDIMLQYTIEGLVIMFANVVLSVVVGITILITYKFFELNVNDYQFVVTMSYQSMLLYGFFTFFLAVLCSLIFAYKGTCVEIIKYLKEEL